MASGPQQFGGEKGAWAFGQRVKWATRSSSAIKQAASFNEVLSFYNGVAASS